MLDGRPSKYSAAVRVAAMQNYRRRVRMEGGVSRVLTVGAHAVNESLSYAMSLVFDFFVRGPKYATARTHLASASIAAADMAQGLYAYGEVVPGSW